MCRFRLTTSSSAKVKQSGSSGRRNVDARFGGGNFGISDKDKCALVLHLKLDILGKSNKCIDRFFVPQTIVRRAIDKVGICRIRVHTYISIATTNPCPHTPTFIDLGSFAPKTIPLRGSEEWKLGQRRAMSAVALDDRFLRMTHVRTNTHESNGD